MSLNRSSSGSIPGSSPVLGMLEVGNSGEVGGGFSFFPNPPAKSFVDLDVEGIVKANAVVVDRRRSESDSFMVVVVVVVVVVERVATVGLVLIDWFVIV